MNQNPDFIDRCIAFLSDPNTPIWQKLAYLILFVAASTIYSRFYSNRFKSLYLRIAPWGRLASNFKENLISEFGFSHSHEMIRYEDGITVRGNISGYLVKIEIAAGIRRSQSSQKKQIEILKGFTVIVTIDLKNNPFGLLSQVLPKTVDEMTTIQGKSLIRLMHFDNSSTAEFKINLDEMIKIIETTPAKRASSF